MQTHKIWKRGWLKNKPYCWNPEHPHYNPTIDKIVRDLNKGQNRIIILVGVPRSGKSWFSIWLMAFMNWCYFGIMPSFDDIYWMIDDFIEATKNPKNKNKFIVMEEQGVQQYKSDWQKIDVIGFDKITQIFGVDNTNLIINLPYIFDLTKGTRLKGHYLLRTVKKSKTKVDIFSCPKRMNLTTEKGYYSVKDSFHWVNVPNIFEIPNKEVRNKMIEIMEKYENKKLEYNLKKKEDIGNQISGMGKTRRLDRERSPTPIGILK